METLVSQDIEQARAFLEDGQLVSVPTETVYGMAANGFNQLAVQQIFKVKNRPFYDPLILHTDSIEKIAQWGMKVPPELLSLARMHWPGPLTILVDKSDYISDLVTSGLPRVAFRVPNHRLTRELLSTLDFPLAAPSANPFGYVSPTKVGHVYKHFSGKIPMILDGGDCRVGIESTIVGEEEGQVILYRLGGLSLEEVQEEVGEVQVKISSSKPAAPGMLIKHYAPKKEIIVVDTLKELKAIETRGSAYILFKLSLKVREGRLVQLSTQENDRDAAAKFYAALQQWDEEDSVTRIVIERLPDLGLGRAINDRLQRAAASH